MQKKKTTLTYKVFVGLIRFFYPKTQVLGEQNLPEEPAIIVANHTQMNGPIVCELYFPRERYTWCAGQMMDLKEVPGYAFQDFWSQKPKHTHWFYKILSYLIALPSVCLFNNANTIGVYHDTRIIKTFKETMKILDEGASVVIFPEHDVKHNHVVYEFQDRFIDLAKHYHKRTGKELCFVPMYIAPNLRQAHIGKPIRFQSAQPLAQERSRIRDYLMAEITHIAESLPEHTVVPYRNIPKKDYPSNIPREVRHEDTSG